MMNEILMQAIDDIENLQEYYFDEMDYLKRKINKHIGKYKYGVALDRFFFNKVHNAEEIKESENEKKLLDEILEEYEIQEKEGRKVIKYKLKNNENLKETYELNPYVARQEYFKLIEQPSILSESTLIMLLVKYEEAIAGIYRYLLHTYPQAYLREKTITYSDLVELNIDVDNILNRFIEDEVDEFMRKPIGDWYRTFFEKHKVEIGEILEDFKEIYYRRNIVVHNQGIVNSSYMNNIHSVEYIIGDTVNVDSQYLEKAIQDTIIMIYGTFWGLQKVNTENCELKEYLFDQGYKNMKQNRWNISKYIFSLLISDKEQENAELICNKINYWLSVKNIEGLEAIKDEVEKFDVSAMQGQFQVAKYALLNKNEEVSSLLDTLINDEIQAFYIKDWPLFNQYRETKEYQVFVEKHKDVMADEEYETDSASVLDEEQIIMELGTDIVSLKK